MYYKYCSNLLRSVKYLQWVGYFVRHDDSALWCAKIVGGDASGAELADGEVPLGFVPRPQEAVHVEIRHRLMDKDNFKDIEKS